MDARRIGRSVRALRIRAGQRQIDVAGEARISRQQIGRIEAGELDGVTVGSLERAVTALGGSFDVTVRWHGEGLDRLLDAAHAGLVEQVVARFPGGGGKSGARQVDGEVRTNV